MVIHDTVMAHVKCVWLPLTQQGDPSPPCVCVCVLLLSTTRRAPHFLMRWWRPHYMTASQVKCWAQQKMMAPTEGSLNTALSQLIVEHCECSPGISNKYDDVFGFTNQSCVSGYSRLYFMYLWISLEVFFLNHLMLNG